jgi:hypothetical protein
MGDIGKKAIYEEASNLHAILLLSLGAWVMLIENIWIENGLVNSALSTIHDIIWLASLDCHRDPPFVVLVAFDGYNGPALNRDEVTKIIPFFQSTREFIYKSSNHR